MPVENKSDKKIMETSVTTAQSMQPITLNPLLMIFFLSPSFSLKRLTVNYQKWGIQVSERQLPFLFSEVPLRYTFEIKLVSVYLAV